VVEIEARSLRKVYASRRGAVTALDGLDFSARAGEFVAIVGPSGCGKSTFLYILGGFITPSDGVATVDGTPIAGPDPARGIVFQEFVLFPWKTVLGNVTYGLAQRGVPSERAGTSIW
jgi:NitT/TauT family transport system ATP-binding protein